MKSIAFSALAITVAATQFTLAQDQDQPRKVSAKQQAAVQRLVTAGNRAPGSGQVRQSQVRTSNVPARQFASPRAQEFRPRPVNPNINQPARVVTNPTASLDTQQRIYTPNNGGNFDAGRRNGRKWRNRDVNGNPDANGDVSVN